MTSLVALGPAAADALAEVHASAFDRPWDGADLADMMAGLGAGVIAVEAGGRVLGFVLYQAAGGEAEILTLAVRPEARRQGVGRTLVEAAAAGALSADASTLWLDVAADNTAALALYTATGFEALGRRRDYYRVGRDESIDAIVMRRALNTEPTSPYSP